MKNIFLPAAIIVLIATACKKDRSCTCTITRTGGFGTTKGQTVMTAGKKTKKDFKEDSRCYNSTTTQVDPNEPSAQIKTETTCTLK
jgi:hypothetical protein